MTQCLKRGGPAQKSIARLSKKTAVGQIFLHTQVSCPKKREQSFLRSLKIYYLLLCSLYDSLDYLGIGKFLSVSAVNAEAFAAALSA